MQKFWHTVAAACALAVAAPVWAQTFEEQAAGSQIDEQQPASPHQVYGELFEAVQMKQVFADGKTFVDAEPLQLPEEIMARYRVERPQSQVELRAFVERHFSLPEAGTATDLRSHIQQLWSELTRPPLNPPAGSSALAMPSAYVVPGGRFREIYYWDSYFTMLGLRADGRDELVESMLDGFTGLIERYGHIPNGSRTYYLSRSQPPFFGAMVALSNTQDTALASRRLRAMRTEHAYWMAGAKWAAREGECERVVRLSDGSILNRYWDDRDTPRDESYREDVETVARAERESSLVYRDLRAAAESGWDFSSRWLADGDRLETVRTTRIVPVDLNSLLWLLEREIAEGCVTMGDGDCAEEFSRLANARQTAIGAHLWSAEEGRFVDLDLDSHKATPRLSAATLYPLFVGLATQEQADAVAVTTRNELVATGGLRTTRLRTGQQWDAPNGWAPLQWVAIAGLERYGHEDLAREIARRWVETVERTWEETGKLLEKYDIEERREGGGGEYPTQDGFGWTNGVTSAILEKYPNLLHEP